MQNEILKIELDKQGHIMYLLNSKGILDINSVASLLGPPS